MNKKITIVVGIIVIVIAVGIVMWQANTRALRNDSRTAGTETPQTTPPVVTAYTLAEVATHNKQSDCWAVVNGGVYNFTSWIASHPGGAQAIIGLCGTDGSATFNAQHGGQGGPEKALANFRIGTLK